MKKRKDRGRATKALRERIRTAADGLKERAKSMNSEENVIKVDQQQAQEPEQAQEAPQSLEQDADQRVFHAHLLSGRPFWGGRSPMRGGRWGVGPARDGGPGRAGVSRAWR